MTTATPYQPDRQPLDDLADDVIGKALALLRDARQWRTRGWRTVDLFTAEHDAAMALSAAGHVRMELQPDMALVIVAADGGGHR